VDNNTWYSLSGVKLAESAHCIVYADVAERVSLNTAEVIANKYETGIRDKITGVFGDYLTVDPVSGIGKFDVDGNGKIILLLLNIQDGYSGSGGYVAGYFDATHLQSKSVFSQSNQADMLFLDIYPQTAGGEGFYSTIAHELQHLTNYAKHNGIPQDIWINEGLSSAAEYIHGGHQVDRVNYFNVDPLDTILYGNNFFVWDGYWERLPGVEDSLANYATVYLFFQWLRIHAISEGDSTGTGIYTEIINYSTYRDYRAVIQAVTSKFPAGSFTGTDATKWGQILSSWMIANYVKASSGLYGYKGEIVPMVRRFQDGEIIKLENYFSPGEGIYSDLDGNSVTAAEVAGSGLHIKYAGITSGGTVDRAAPYDGTWLLTYNADTDPDPYSFETGFIMNWGSVAEPSATAPAAAARSAASLPASYPIGRHDLEAARGAGRDIPTKPRTGQ
jgi:hypothetical protein